MIQAIKIILLTIILSSTLIGLVWLVYVWGYFK